jgi:putative transposase
MKGKRYTTEEKIRILRQADGGGTILEVCREANISEVTFHRWKKQFGQILRHRQTRMANGFEQLERLDRSFKQ